MAKIDYPNILDAESAYLSAHADFEVWRAKFELYWKLPLFRSALAGLLKELPPEMRSTEEASRLAQFIAKGV